MSVSGPPRRPSGETWSTKCSSGGVKTRSKKIRNFSFLGADPQTGSRNRKLTDRIFRGPKGLRCVKIRSGYMQGLRRNFGRRFEKFKVISRLVLICRFFLNSQRIFVIQLATTCVNFTKIDVWEKKLAYTRNAKFL